MADEGSLTLDVMADAGELAERLRDFAGRLTSLARASRWDAVELLTRANVLQRAAFVLAASGEFSMDLASAPSGRT